MKTVELGEWINFECPGSGPFARNTVISLLAEYEAPRTSRGPQLRLKWPQVLSCLPLPKGFKATVRRWVRSSHCMSKAPSLLRLLPASEDVPQGQCWAERSLSNDWGLLSGPGSLSESQPQGSPRGHTGVQRVRIVEAGAGLWGEVEKSWPSRAVGCPCEANGARTVGKTGENWKTGEAVGSTGHGRPKKPATGQFPNAGLPSLDFFLSLDHGPEIFKLWHCFPVPSSRNIKHFNQLFQLFSAKGLILLSIPLSEVGISSLLYFYSPIYFQLLFFLLTEYRYVCFDPARKSLYF